MKDQPPTRSTFSLLGARDHLSDLRFGLRLIDHFEDRREPAVHDDIAVGLRRGRGVRLIGGLLLGLQILITGVEVIPAGRRGRVDRGTTGRKILGRSRNPRTRIPLIRTVFHHIPQSRFRRQMPLNQLSHLQRRRTSLLRGGISIVHHRDYIDARIFRYRHSNQTAISSLRINYLFTLTSVD
jgi:hypothetical protein